MRTFILLSLLMLIASVSTAQNVGIGTGNPQYPLHVMNTDGFTGTAINLHGPGQVGGVTHHLIRFTHSTNHDHSNQSSSYIGGGRRFDDTYFLSFGTSPSNNPPMETMRLTGNGSLGIGTIVPNDKLHVAGGGRFETGVMLAPFTHYLDYYQEATFNAIFFNGANVYLGSYTMHAVRVGKQVTLTFPTDAITMSVTNVNDIILVHIPLGFRTTSNLFIPVRIRNGGINGLGVCWFNDNELWFKPTIAGGTWNGPATGIYATSITYSVQ
jgi:hypothetical protein